MKQAPAAGFEGVLIKPIIPSLLFETTIRLFRDEPAPVEGGHRSAGAEIASLPAALRGARVLLVEDNDVNQQVAIELLEDAGLSVDLAENGAVALERLDASKDGHYDLVLMDMQMPVMDGIAATGALRKQARFADLPILAMTANVMAGERERCREAGMNDHIAKPIDPPVLFATLARWLKPRADLSAQPVPLRRPAAAEDTGGFDPSRISIAGLDVALGLSRVLGKRRLYGDLLRRFAEDQAQAPDRVAESLDQGDLATARRIAHTAKGLAGNIGAAPAQERAAALETAIADRAPRAEIDPLLAAWGEELRPLVAALAAALPDLPTAPAHGAVDAAHQRDVVQRLAALLRADDSGAVDLIATEADALRAALGAHAFGALAEAAHAFDFDTALRALDRIPAFEKHAS
jgi:CheY-like chemotaxis protein